MLNVDIFAFTHPVHGHYIQSYSTAPYAPWTLARPSLGSFTQQLQHRPQSSSSSTALSPATPAPPLNFFGMYKFMPYYNFVLETRLCGPSIVCFSIVYLGILPALSWPPFQTWKKCLCVPQAKIDSSKIFPRTREIAILQKSWQIWVNQDLW